MENKQYLIHLDWDGPYTLDDLVKISDEKTDYGVYQIYGYHPIYGNDVLLYIGKASEQTFAKRISQERWTNTNNYNSVRIYVGRLAGCYTPKDKTWVKEINLAEKLLIYSHKPAYNAMSINQIPDVKLENIHLLNWGLYNRLLPEVSGKRWTKIFNDLTNYEVYGDH